MNLEKDVGFVHVSMVLRLKGKKINQIRIFVCVCVCVCVCALCILIINLKNSFELFFLLFLTYLTRDAAGI